MILTPVYKSITLNLVGKSGSSVVIEPYEENIAVALMPFFTADASAAHAIRNTITSELAQMTTAFTNSQTRYVEQFAFS